MRRRTILSPLFALLVAGQLAFGAVCSAVCVEAAGTLTASASAERATSPHAHCAVAAPRTAGSRLVPAAHARPCGHEVVTPVRAAWPANAPVTLDRVGFRTTVHDALPPAAGRFWGGGTGPPATPAALRVPVLRI